MTPISQSKQGRRTEKRTPTNKMTPTMSTFLFLLSFIFCLALATARPLTSAATSSLITKACSLAPNKNLCHKVLNSERMSPKNNLNDLTFVALDVSSTAAATNIEFISQSLAESADDAVMQSFTECDKQYEGAVIGIDNSISYLTSGPEQIEALLKDAISAVETCQKGVKGQTGKGLELFRENQSLLDLLHNALSIYHVYIQK